MTGSPSESLSDILERAKELQQEEYEVLESIYPECVSNEFVDSILKLEVPIQFDSARRVTIVADGSLGQSKIGEGNTVSLSLTTLPSLMMHVKLPERYPIEQPPGLESIRAKHLWLPQPTRLHDALIQQWKPGEGALYDWIEFIRTGGFLEGLGLSTHNDVIQYVPVIGPGVFATV
ncbi:hypothetical protein AX16_005503 [Volvariella volvacea WC 439]|nr:hypothetical protein AX16_005503 [Volvariella volvacea WC 439]